MGMGHGIEKVARERKEKPDCTNGLHKWIAKTDSINGCFYEITNSNKARTIRIGP